MAHPNFSIHYRPKDLRGTHERRVRPRTVRYSCHARRGTGYRNGRHRRSITVRPAV